MDYQLILNELHQNFSMEIDKGKVASYIPELKKIDPNKFGICLQLLSGETYGTGDFQYKFSIQSISKVIALTLTLQKVGNNLWKRVGVEPSGDPFNSLVQLEFEKGIPRNPLINSGALVVCDILLSKLKNPKKEYLDFVMQLANNNNLNYNKNIISSEKKYGFKNAAHVNLMKSFGNIKNNPETVLDFYYHICSIEMTCEELASTFLVYANGGVLPHNNERIISKSFTKRINATTQLCGLYDEAGKFAFKVGLPGKSGVGGGIVAVHPGNYSIAVWSPKLNKKGNSVKGLKVLEAFTTKTELSIF